MKIGKAYYKVKNEDEFNELKKILEASNYNCKDLIDYNSVKNTIVINKGIAYLSSEYYIFDNDFDECKSLHKFINEASKEDKWKLDCNVYHKIIYEQDHNEGTFYDVVDNVIAQLINDYYTIISIQVIENSRTSTHAIIFYKR